MTPRSLAALGLVFTSLAGCLAATAPRQQALFSSHTLGVRVDVLVTEGNKPMAGLTKDDFELRDNNVVQTIAAVETDLPINAVLLLDTSGSTEGKPLADLVDATRALVDGLTPKDRAALTTFNDVVTPLVPLTSDFSTLRSAINHVVPSGGTALMDGVSVALMATIGESGRSLVVVCTDGRDTASWLQPDEVIDSAKRSNAVIYAVAAGAARRWPDLQSLADTTGGRMIEIEKSSDYRVQLQRILDEFRGRYVLAFMPSGVTAGGYHRLDVRVRRGGVTVKARPGYISGGSGTPP